ncbi:MAG: glucoamylase family protein, partial [Ectothiorhodospiraceae bacterium]
ERRETAPLNTAELWALPLLLRFECLCAVLDSVKALCDAGEAGGREQRHGPAAGDLVANGIWSLHQLERADWKGFFERTSAVHQTLAEEPTGAYSRMDFETRDRYREAVEKLARHAGCDEVEVAKVAVRLCRTAYPKPEDGNAATAAAHVGYYLIDRGRTRLEQEIGYRPGAMVATARWLDKRKRALYLCALGGTGGLLVALPALYAAHAGTPWDALVVGLVVLVPGATIASVLVNWVATLSLSPRVLPKLDFTTGIERDHRAAITVSLLIGDAGDVSRALERIERHYLANTDPNLRYGLLTGLFDADSEFTPRDAPLLETLRQGVDALNKRYGGESGQPFFWMHRHRCWDPRDGIWMEWERKRGKLHEFNRFVLTGEKGTFTDGAGDLQALRGIRYVVTLDADTVLPVDAARRLVGTMAHPLNQPVLNPETGTVQSGYTILQPRVEINPMTASRNFFTRVFSGDRGLDIYTLAVSDAYQDVFGEGIYTGKGLYHVAAFEASLKGAVPESAVLSHDLFEGIHGRAALVSDIVAYEDYPGDYPAYLRRLHRWIRGDWQLLPWLGSRVPSAEGKPRRNRLDAVHRWQIAHNLLRSLQSPTLMLLLLLGWFALRGSPLRWTALALITLLVPTLTNVVGLAPKTLRRRRAARLLRDLGGDVRRWLLAVAFLPQETAVALDAIVRSVYRTFVSRKGLLEWTPAAMEEPESLNRSSAARFWRVMWIGPVVALLLSSALLLVDPGTMWFAGPVLLLWLLSPQIAFLAQRGHAPVAERIRDEDRTHLRRIARRTWFFFERFVGPEDHWLPPDHFQERPKGIVAHRTSPTNIGLLLASNATAYDLGYVDAEELLLRTRNTLQTVASLQRFRGHLLNWYDTHHLRPLPPAYVSTVDSGNLMGCLLLVKQVAAATGSERAWRFALFEGLLDAVGVLEDTLAPFAATTPRSALARELRAMRATVLRAKRRKRDWPALVVQVSEAVRDGLDPAVQAVLREPDSLPTEALADLRMWLERSHHHVSRLLRSRDRFLPWWNAIADAPGVLDAADCPKAVTERWHALQAALVIAPTLADLEDASARLDPLVAALKQTAIEQMLPGRAEVVCGWLERLADAVPLASQAAEQVLGLATEVEGMAERLFSETDMTFLYDHARDVFRIGYNVEQGVLDQNAYDLLASEARLASLVAIAKGDVPARHWVHLGRPMTSENSDLLLLSWSGTLFEYLMPELLMKEPITSLLGHSARAAVDSQIRYGAARGIPWGISESGYYAFDPARNYSYHAFGAPQLALRAEKGMEELVVAPYASFLALHWRPQAAMDNLRELESLGMLGRYGFFEAVDFTRHRQEIGASHAVVESYMAHHHGMSLVSVGNALGPPSAIKRFDLEP